MCVCVCVCVRPMWSCCSWLCVDDVPSEEPARRGHCQQAYTNSGYSSQPSANQQPRCKACGDGFHTLARKVTMDTTDPDLLTFMH